MLASFSVVHMGAGEGIKEIVAEALTIVDGSAMYWMFASMESTRFSPGIGSFSTLPIAWRFASTMVCMWPGAPCISSSN